MILDASAILAASTILLNKTEKANPVWGWLFCWLKCLGRSRFGIRQTRSNVFCLEDLRPGANLLVVGEPSHVFLIFPFRAGLALLFWVLKRELKVRRCN